MYRRIIPITGIILTVLFNSFSIESEPLNNDRTIEVEIRGCVENPGVYELKLGSTYEDLFENAVLNDNSDIGNYALQDVLYNRQVIVIPELKNEKKISINSASLDELSSLPGIGKSIAQRIIDYRRNYGSFLTLEEIINVSGIGYAKFNKIKEYITL